MEWFWQSLYWYIYLFIIGIVFFPVTKRLFPRFLDRGYAFSKTIGIIVISYVSFILGIVHLAPFYQITLYILLVLAAVFNFFLLKKDTDLKQIFHDKRTDLILIAFEEAICLVSLLFLAWVRGHEPSIHGLEKFMDFGFMNSILRSTYFPPLDMWLSADTLNPHGYPINYYYFGHLSGAMLIKLSGVSAFAGYNLVLATILALSMSQVFSFIATFIHYAQKVFVWLSTPSRIYTYVLAAIGTLIVNFAGNLHTIYLFTSGYKPETPVPFWTVLLSPSTIFHSMAQTGLGLLQTLVNLSQYWYPNATRFIPFTIHEFPSYSYVVADLHGHVFDIPFVTLTLAILFSLIVFFKDYIYKDTSSEHVSSKNKKKNESNAFFPQTFALLAQWKVSPYQISMMIILGFLTSVHYMTNAFDGPIYILLTIIVLTVIYKISIQLVVQIVALVVSFILFSLPFSIHFAPFVSGIGVNCSPDFLVAKHKIGPFLFEKGNCQHSEWWMLILLWGFFWINFGILLGIILFERKLSLRGQKTSIFQYSVALFKGESLTGKKHEELPSITLSQFDTFALTLFSFGTLLILIPEFFYIKDIYPAHFRANTMFKLGYQAFIMMSIASTYVLYRLKTLQTLWKYIIQLFYSVLLCLILIYPFLSFPSYYGELAPNDQRPVTLNGIGWLQNLYPEDVEIIDYLNTHIADHPVILEAQGDSYTDYERISANTGLPTVAGWWVHEWLWRGSPDVVGKRIPDIVNMYESSDLVLTKDLLKNYHVQYIVVSRLEKTKYQNLNEAKMSRVAKKIFESTNKLGAIYQVVQ